LFYGVFVGHSTERTITGAFKSTGTTNSVIYRKSYNKKGGIAKDTTCFNTRATSLLNFSKPSHMHKLDEVEFFLELQQWQNKRDQ
jgi:hypothetical protein